LELAILLKRYWPPRWESTYHPLCLVYPDWRAAASVRNRLSAATEIEMIQELDSVILTTDLPEYGLKRGDIGTVGLTHQGGEGYEVEFVTLDGETVAVVSLHASQVRPIWSRRDCPRPDCGKYPATRIML
jgi:hypothetical protein